MSNAPDDENRQLKNQLTLARASSAAAHSMMMDLQQDCIAHRKLLTELRDAAAALTAVIPTRDTWPWPPNDEVLMERAEKLRAVIGRVP